jgi:phosphate transport system protein
MMRDAIEALLKKNEDLARSVCERDDEVDEFRIQIFRELLTYMLEDTRNINQGIPLSSVSHYLERIGDHATNIAENAIYVTSGEDIRHPADRKRKE